MTALAKDRAKSERVINRDKRPLGAGVKAIKGGMVGCNAAGFFVPMAATAGMVFVGYFYETVDNTAGGNGAKLADVHFVRQRHLLLMVNDGVAPVVIAKRERPITTLDDQTVSNTAPAAGDGVRCYDVTTEGVWIERL